VAGVLRGTDPSLGDKYLLVTANYDGLGQKRDGSAEIRPGANDNASGTVALMAVAEALVDTTVKLRRSIVFVAWTGEEAGALGSRHYLQAPLIPLFQTVVNINLEQIGRSDGHNGSGTRRMMLLGYGYSDVGIRATEAAKSSGVEVYAGPNEFYRRSDNVFFARTGIPAHTLASSLEFPDYHTAGDSAEKLDYDNMAQLTRAITRIMIAVANAGQDPEWNASEGETPQIGPLERKNEPGVNGKIACR
jgi:Zn-dependent M28 family amino/carboxypeptidase